jgi:hypothetical protein
MGFAEAANLRKCVAQVQTPKKLQKHGVFWVQRPNLRTKRGAKTFCGATEIAFAGCAAWLQSVGCRATGLDLEFLMQESGMAQADLGRLLGNRALASLILRRHRQLSKTHIRKLASHFKVSPALLLPTE